MKTLADFLGYPTIILWGCVVYAAVQVVFVLLYKAAFAKKGFVKLPYQGLLFLNVVVNIVTACVTVVVNLGWNWGAMLCASMVFAIIAVFECYVYYYWAVKHLMRDDF